MLFGRVSRKIILKNSQGKNKLHHIQLSDTTGTSSMVRWNWKKSILAAPDEFSTDKDKK